MNLANEAAYLYRHATELRKINKQLHKLSIKAQRRVDKHGKAKTEKEKQKHSAKHRKISTEIKHLLSKHKKIVNALQHHELAFRHALHKEHKI